MSRSQYLAQALQAMSQKPVDAQPMGLPAEELAALGKRRDAWETANPGQSYLGHNLKTAGHNLAAAPGQMMGGLRNLAQMVGIAPR